MSTERRVEPQSTRFIQADRTACTAVAILLLCLCASGTLLVRTAPRAIQKWLATSTPQPTPTPRPTPTLASAPPGTTLAYHSSVTVLHALPDFPASYAVDGNRLTWWGSGHPAPEWIDIDLGADYVVSLIRLLPLQDTPGITVHSVFVCGTATGDQYSLLHTFHGPTPDAEWLIVRLPETLRGVRHVRIETLSGPSRVGWREIEVLAEEE